ncbi:hypothetical protein T265_08520 [Opisthorchis viverrini]|uniref:Biopterin-dependent aromatic amino acid hydroxylase family profile domain-containing protein n=1 Tax=Opisthorchis viverrini TaxID=6198 RepID=A0A075A825_OPIVI|nr:hypothetical protein T265_08520 [Opisthorchis viverrini]KER23619.1 hypothetical protein T265_08520 [Opisthorchis viverrini]
MQRSFEKIHRNTAEKHLYHAIVHFHEGEVSFTKELQRLLECLSSKLDILHLETRRASKSIATNSCFLQLKCETVQFDSVVCGLRSEPFVSSIKILDSVEDNEDRWIPHHISDLDKCQHLLTKVFMTKYTRKDDTRLLSLRSTISTVNSSLKRTYIALKERHEGHACQEYTDGFRILEQNGLFSPDLIPSVRAVSDFLKRTSGFQLRPVAGLVSSRDFLANFAFRVFPCTQYVRHHSQPQHTPEPDLIHEFLGHIPLLTNRKFADFSQMLGLASLSASDEAIKKITTLFWFTVEFGLCNEKSGLRAFGAGILSSYGELDNALSDQSEKRPFDPDTAAIQPYNDVGYQPVYFVCERFDTMTQQLEEYVKNLVHPKLWPRYDPITDSVELLNMEQQCLDVLERLSNSTSEMKTIVEKLYVFDLHGA